jgi:16S rRNA (guanine527-N7)-methyltransferase
MPDDTELLAVLESLRERGALGEASLPAAVAHADLFLAAIPQTCQRLLDLGSGGGLPGLVLACRLEHVAVVLTDRRERRMDLLRLASTRLGLQDRVSVVTADVVDLARDGSYVGSFDVVTARAFGDPLWTLRCGAPFLTSAGVIVVSEPPVVDVADRWPDAEIARLGLRASTTSFAQVQRFERV